MEIVTVAQRPELLDAMYAMPKSWPTFMYKDPVARLMSRLPTSFPELQFAALDGDEVVGTDQCAVLGFGSLFGPVRPSHKSLEPTVPIANYVARRRSDGLRADPWLRVHERLGAHFVKIAPTSMTVSGTLAAWRDWTGLPFDVSGDVLVRGALVPVHASVEHDHAVYVEPNAWMQHPLV